MKTFHVYILASHSRNLYIGVTDDLECRVFEHRARESPDSFIAKYNIDQLVYFEDTTDIIVAIEREKQLKGWRRAKKISLIEKTNPHWSDLSERWYDQRSVEKSAFRSHSELDPSTPASTPALRMTEP